MLPSCRAEQGEPRSEVGATRSVDAATDAPGSPPAAAAAANQLRTMAYTAGTFDPNAELEGVILHDRARAEPGLNFFTSRDLPAAFLLDMEGKVVHRWRGPAPLGKGDGTGWEHAELYPNGDVVALIKDEALLRFDRDSEPIWRVDLRFHHDHATAADGTIYALTRRQERLPEVHPRHPVLADYVTVISPAGEVLREIALIPLLRRSLLGGLLPQRQERDFSRAGERPEDVEIDYLHTNHIEIFDGSVEGRLFRAGLALMSFRQINTIAILDLDSAEVLWFWGPFNLQRQHHPTLLPNGNILVFNNRLRRSAVLEVDPASYQIVWRYEDDQFFTLLRGSNQRLPGGNTLITESDTGYVFEVTPSGDKVWEFANPRIDDEQVRSAIWRMVRFAPEDLDFEFAG